MTQAWGGISLGNVNTGGALTQLYPNWLQAGSASAGVKTRRRPNEGVISRMEVVPAAGIGGVFELWDLAGTLTGTNQVNSAASITNAFLLAEQARTPPRARLIWSVDFSGDLDGVNKLLGVRVVFARGLAARYIQAATPGTNIVTINMVVDGGYQLWEGELPG
jgi:hypothetical protein